MRFSSSFWNLRNFNTIARSCGILFLLSLPPFAIPDILQYYTMTPHRAWWGMPNWNTGSRTDLKSWTISAVLHGHCDWHFLLWLIADNFGIFRTLSCVICGKFGIIGQDNENYLTYTIELGLFFTRLHRSNTLTAWTIHCNGVEHKATKSKLLYLGDVEITIIYNFLLTNQ